jgi:hypothetical protein
MNCCYCGVPCTLCALSAGVADIYYQSCRYLGQLLDGEEALAALQKGVSVLQATIDSQVQTFIGLKFGHSTFISVHVVIIYWVYPWARNEGCTCS